MTSNPRTDAVIAAWLDDGPTRLTAAERSEIGDAAELIAQRRSIFRIPLAGPRRAVVFATAMLVLALTLTPLVLPALIGPEPTPSPSPTPSVTSSPVAPSPSQVATACSRAIGSPTAWTGRVRTDLAGIPVDCPSASRGDPEAAALAWADILSVSGIAVYTRQPQWRLQLGQVPPLQTDRERDGLVLEYGLVFETTGDDVPDFVVGINDEGAEAGDYRVWVTNLDTNSTNEVLGPPYGYPVEFRHPDETRRDIPDGVAQMTFTFLGTPPYAPLDHPLRYYAWASATRNGEIVAWDYAPDFGWVTAGPR